MAQAGTARAPWPVTTVVSCLPVLVLGMGTALAHLLRADAAAADALDSQARQPGVLRSLSPQDQAGPGGRRRETDRDRSTSGTSTVPGRDHDMATGSRDLAHSPPDRRRIRPA